MQKSIGELETRLEEVQEKMNTFYLNPYTTHHYLLGLTGSGKSTFTNYMLGAELTYKKKLAKWQIKNENSKDICPQIGNTPASCTVTPATFMSKEGMCIVDPAGFLDTKGAIQEIVNSYANAKMFQKYGKIKLLIMVEQSTFLSGRGGGLVEVANRLRELFPKDFKNIVHSIMIVVSKVNPEDIEEDDAIYQLISEIISQNQSFSVESQMMLSTILEFKRVALFPYPKYMNDEKVKSIKEKIQSLNECILSQDATISLSSNAKIQIDSFMKKQLKRLNDYKNLIKGEIQNKFQSRNYSNPEELKPALRKLGMAISVLQSQLEGGLIQAIEKFAQQIELPEGIQTKVKEILQKIQLCQTLHVQIKMNINFISFLISSLQESKNILSAKLEKLVSREEIDEINKKHEKALAQRKQQFNQMMNQLRNDAAKREDQAQNHLKKQQENYKQILNNSNKMFQQNMERYEAMLQEKQRNLLENQKIIQKKEYQAQENLKRQQNNYKQLINKQNKQAQENLRRQQNNYKELINNQNKMFKQNMSKYEEMIQRKEQIIKENQKTIKEQLDKKSEVTYVRRYWWLF